MSVISISLIESANQIVANIPYSVSLNANIPSSIFYTLDGNIPTVNSLIYTSPILLGGGPTVTLQYFATNGVDSSPIIKNVYQTNTTVGQNARVPHSGTNAQPGSSAGTQDLSPFGNATIQPNQQFLGAAEAGLTVYDPVLPAGPSTGFDGNGNPDGYTNSQYIGIPSKAFPVQYSESDFEGQMGHGIGTLPKYKMIQEGPPPQQSDINSPLFDPRALVIIQDLTQPVDSGLPVHINKMSFTLEDVEHTRTGNQFFNVGLDAPPTTGSFLRSHYNPSDQTTTYYYFDSSQNRWIISKSNTIPKSPISDYSSGMVFKRNGGAGMVFSWVGFKGQYLY